MQKQCSVFMRAALARDSQVLLLEKPWHKCPGVDPGVLLCSITKNAAHAMLYSCFVGHVTLHDTERYMTNAPHTLYTYKSKSLSSPLLWTCVAGT